MSTGHHPDCFHQSGAIPPNMPCPCRDWFASRQRVDDLKLALGDDAGWFDRCMAAERKLADIKKRVALLEERINDHVGHWGVCDSADDDGESLVCGSDKCSYCALVLAAGGLARHA